MGNKWTHCDDDDIDGAPDQAEGARPEQAHAGNLHTPIHPSAKAFLLCLKLVVQTSLAGSIL